jgi:hypothetical protein
LPVFAGPAGGLAAPVGPAAGYLFGFVAAAFVTGFLAEPGWDRSMTWPFAAMAIGPFPGLLSVSGLAPPTPGKGHRAVDRGVADQDRARGDFDAGCAPGCRSLPIAGQRQSSSI